MPERVTVTIADLSIAIQSQVETWAVNLSPAYRPFQKQAGREVRLDLSTMEPPAEAQSLLFETPPIWSLYRRRKGVVFHLFDSYPDLRRRLYIPNEGADARLVFLSRNRDPFIGPTIELLAITYLARCRGAILHGCGISIDGRGIMFAGESGAGKSTLSRIWAPEKGVELLSDDRLIVRRQHGGLRLYGTPWHGDETCAAFGGVKLNRIFFLRHGRNNQVRELTAGRAVAAMLQCSFPPLWDADGTAAALDLFDAMAAAIPCEELFFEPDVRVMEVVRRRFC
jgi:hypothetical protein